MATIYKLTTWHFIYGSVLLISPLLQVSVGTSKASQQQWGEWASWASCSAPCGQGIATRTRQCFRADASIRPTSVRNATSANCQGASSEIKICSDEACPPEEPSSRQKSCSQYDSRVFSGKQYVWEPFIHPTDACKVSCRAKGIAFYANLADKVEDGTPCNLGLVDAVCVKGECKRVGCDGVVESAALNDTCGVCRGDGSSCRTISGIFTSTDLKRGLNYIISIPKGSTNISITELQTSRNLLILQTATNKTFINNDTRGPSSSIVQAAGTVFSYTARSVSNPREAIHSPGPTNVTVILQLLLRGGNPGILYTFSVPLEVSETVIQQIRHRAQPVELPPDSTIKHQAQPVEMPPDAGLGQQTQSVELPLYSNRNRHINFQTTASSMDDVVEISEELTAQHGSTLSPDLENLEETDKNEFSDSEEKTVSTASILNKVTVDGLLSDHETITKKHSSELYSDNTDIDVSDGSNVNSATINQHSNYKSPDRTPSFEPAISSYTFDNENDMVIEDIVNTESNEAYSNATYAPDTGSGSSMENKSDKNVLTDHSNIFNNDNPLTHKGDVSERFLSRSNRVTEIVAGHSRSSDNNHHQKQSLQSSHKNHFEDPKIHSQELGWDTIDGKGPSIILNTDTKTSTPSDIHKIIDQSSASPFESILSKNVHINVDKAQGDTDINTSIEENQDGSVESSKFSIPRYSQSFTFAEKYKGMNSRDHSRRHRARQQNHPHQEHYQKQGISHMNNSNNNHHIELHIKSRPTQNLNSGRGTFNDRRNRYQEDDYRSGTSEFRASPSVARNDHNGVVEGYQSNRDEQISREMRLRDRQALIEERRRRVEEQILQYNERLREYQEKLKQRQANIEESRRRNAQTSNGRIVNTGISDSSSHIRAANRDDPNTRITDTSGHIRVSNRKGVDTQILDTNSNIRGPSRSDLNPSSSSRDSSFSSLHQSSRYDDTKLQSSHPRYNDLNEKTHGNRWSRWNNTFVYSDHPTETSSSTSNSDIHKSIQQQPRTNPYIDPIRRKQSAQTNEDVNSHFSNSDHRNVNSNFETLQQNSRRQTNSQFVPRIIQPPRLEHSDAFDGDRTSIYPSQTIPRLQSSEPRYIPGPPYRTASHTGVTTLDHQVQQPSSNQIYNNHHISSSLSNQISYSHHISPSQLPTVYRQPGLGDSLAGQVSVNHPSAAHNTHSTVYEWRVSGLTDCTHSCGGGIQQTMVVCVDTITQAVVTDENCRYIPKPKVLAVPCNTRPCSAEWTPGPWSSCTVSCGTGEQTRTVICQARVSPTLNMTMPNSNCEGQDKIPTKQSCNSNPCSYWRVGAWSNCSSPCGDGQRTREVQCVDLQGNVISDDLCLEFKPDDEDQCNLGECGKGWFFTEWPSECPADCGTGEVTRRVFCSDDKGAALPDTRCDKNQQPSVKQSCRASIPCGGLWFTGPWSKCDSSCGSGNRRRGVLCIKQLPGNVDAIVGEENCEGIVRPAKTEPCEAAPCSSEWYMTSWSQCSKSCGTGYRTREVKCLDQDQKPQDDCPLLTRPKPREACNTHECTDVEIKETEEETGCTDKFTQCKVVKRARLCRYHYYKTICCKSCTDDT